jgi:hypothetical protein
MGSSVSLGNDHIMYLSPQPEAEMVSIESGIILRFHPDWNDQINPSNLVIEVTGSKSGYHEGRLHLASDKKTYIFIPDRYFLTDDTVKVQIEADLTGFEKKFDYQFYTSAVKPQQLEIPEMNNIKENRSAKTDAEPDLITTVINGVSVPGNYPHVNVSILGETAPGRLFLAAEGSTPYFMILENDGTPYFYQRVPQYTRDFKVQPTGTLTRLNRGAPSTYVEMDSTFQIIDTLYCGNGYGVDQHEAQLLLNGNYLFIGIDVQQVDLSELIEGGNPDALVIGNHVLEHDRDGNVVFEWRSWDHFNILDAEHVSLRAEVIDYVHMNSIAVDYDSNLVISSRHLSEVTKINRQTGEIMWRLGGINNQFSFVNDLDSLSYQHDARPVPGMDNHYTIFDNGNHKTPQYSRAVEFLIDTTTMTATKVWEYRHSPDRYAYAMGSVQRLPNGNTLINWSGNPHPVATEVNPQGEIVYEMDFSGGYGNYRTFRFDWSGTAPAPYLILEEEEDRVKLVFNKFGDPEVENYIIYAGLEPNPVTAIDTTSETWIDLTDFKYNERYYFRVTAQDSAGTESEFSNEVNTFINFVPPGENMILNGDFSDGDLFWDLILSNGASATGVLENEEYQVDIDSSGTWESDIQLRQGNISLQENKHYLLEFDAYADSPRTIEVGLVKVSAPFDNYSRIGFVYVPETMSSYSYPFEMLHPSDPQAQLVFNCGYEDPAIVFDNISLKEDLSAGIEGQDDLVPTKYQLDQNFPNPFNPSTIINYELPITNYVELSVFNILGQKVEILVSEEQKTGFYQVEWDARGYSSGIYYYRLQAGNFIDTKKMVIIK